MIEEDNSGGTNRLWLLLQETDTVHLENCKMGREAGSSRRIKKRNKAASTEPRVALVFGDWLTESHRHVKVAYDLGS